MSCNYHKYSAHSPSSNPYSHNHSDHIPHSKTSNTTLASHRARSSLSNNPRLLINPISLPRVAISYQTQCLNLNTILTDHKNLSTLHARAHRRIARYLKSQSSATHTLSNTFNLAAPQTIQPPPSLVVYDYSSAVGSFDLKMTQQPRLHSSLGYIVEIMESQDRHFQ